MRVSPATPHELNSTKRISLCAESIFQRRLSLWNNRSLSFLSSALSFLFFGHVKAGQSEDPHPCGDPSPPRLFDHSLKFDGARSRSFSQRCTAKREGAGVLSTFSRLNWAAAPAHWDVSNSRNSLGTTKETLRTVEQARRQALKCGWRLLLKNASECQNIFKEGPAMRMTAVWV